MNVVVLRLRDCAERGEGRLGGEEDHAVGLRHRGGRSQAGGRGQRRPLPQRRDLDAATVLVEAPPVIGALQHAALAVTEGERAVPVGAAVDEGPHLATRAIQDPGLAQAASPRAAAR